jgi:hypothetical protein
LVGKIDIYFLAHRELFSSQLHGPTCGCFIKVKVKFSLEQSPKAQRGRRGIALLFL